MASSRLASAMTLSAGTKMNSGFLSTNLLMSQGQATRSTFTCSRVIHFIWTSCCIGSHSFVRQHEDTVMPWRDHVKTIGDNEGCRVRAGRRHGLCARSAERINRFDETG